MGYLRKECNFETLDDLIKCIRQDILQAEEILEKNGDSKNLQKHSFFLIHDDDYKDDQNTEKIVKSG